MTAANHAQTANYYARNFAIRRVKASPHGSSIRGYSSTVKPMEQFSIPVYLYNRCGERYVPISGVDHKNQLSYQFITGSDCQFVSSSDSATRAFSNNGPAYYMNFQCRVVASKRIRILYQGRSFGDAVFSVIPGPLKSASVDFDYGSSTIVSD